MKLKPLSMIYMLMAGVLALSGTAAAEEKDKVCSHVEGTDFDAFFREKCPRLEASQSQLIKAVNEGKLDLWMEENKAARRAEPMCGVVVDIMTECGV